MITDVDIEIFLSGTFHQDIEDPIEALQEYIEEADGQWLQYISKKIEDFLESDFAECDKDEFIQKNTYIYYPAIGVEPIEWLKGVLEELRKSAQ